MNPPRRYEAGQDMDAVIAKRLFGYVWSRSKSTGVRFLHRPGLPVPVRMPAFSTTITDAWLVVEKLREHPQPRFRSLMLTAYSYNRTYATFDAEKIHDDQGWSEGNGKYATPLAICLAALVAWEALSSSVGVREKKDPTP